MKDTSAEDKRPGPFNDLHDTLDGCERPATMRVAPDDAVDPDDDVLSWFGLSPDEHESQERPDELAVLSLTTSDDSAPSMVADHEESRWM